jgi:hypothetical protein
MEIYILMAISFAVMFALRYTKEIVISVQEVAAIHKVKPKNLVLYSFSVFLFFLTIVAFPFYATVVVFRDRYTLVGEWVELILLRYYDVELKNNC